MNLDFFEEPELEFGLGRHVDIRFGLMQLHPCDFQDEGRPATIRVGIVGTFESAEGVAKWLEKCREEIEAHKETIKWNLFPKFPGFNEECAFLSKIVLSDGAIAKIHPRHFVSLYKIEDRKERVAEAVETFLGEIAHVAEKKVDVIVCAMPSELIEAMAQDETHEEPEEESEPAEPEAEEDDEPDAPKRLDFHDLLKAASMKHGVPIQVVRPSTYDPTKRKRENDERSKGKRLQDEATRAWNFMTALYYKAKGCPWRLPRNAADLTSCFIGVSFFRTLDEKKMFTSVAQVFNERGDGFIVKGAEAKISKGDLKPYLDAESASRLLRDALTNYRSEHKTPPARVVIHKSSPFRDEELEGFESLAAEKEIEMLNLVAVSRSFTRLHRSGYYPPLRGTYWKADPQRQILYTRGSVEFFKEYPGLYVPRPLLLRCQRVADTPEAIAGEILALSKMNWNNTQFDSSMPITIRAARQVGAILKYFDQNSEPFIKAPYRFYM